MEKRIILTLLRLLLLFQPLAVKAQRCIIHFLIEAHPALPIVYHRSELLCQFTLLRFLREVQQFTKTENSPLLDLTVSLAI